MEISRYFDASVKHAHLTAADAEGEDSDLKWLQVIRGEREGVARMAGLDHVHKQEVNELARKEEEKQKEEERRERQKKKWEDEREV